MASDKVEKRVSKLVALLKELFQLDQPDLDFDLGAFQADVFGHARRACPSV